MANTKKNREGASEQAVMSIAPFEAPQLKIARAKRHLHELESEVLDFLASKPFALMVEAPEAFQHTGSHAWTARIRKPIPTQFSTVIGDVIHNLRSSLDLMACDLVRLTGKSAEKVYFPFCNAEEDFHKTIKERHLHHAGAEVVELIKNLKPWRGGNVPLRAIHDLDIQDKHQALVPMAAFTASSPITLTGLGNSPVNVPSIPTRFKDGQWVMVIMPIANLPLGSEAPAHFDLTFGPETGPLSGKILIASLRQFVSLTDSIVELFATRFSTQSTPRGD
jgi:hypothetical protein